MAVRYKILEELGAGGAGAVFKAYDTQLDRYVAVKRLMSKEESEKEDSQAGVLRKEAASLATLQHPNIVSVYDLGSDDDGFFMVMELVEGETLAEWVRTVPMTLTDFKELSTQSLEAVMTAHSQSILHRDLKPENIKIKRLPGGRIQVKVLDFGLARMSYGAKKMTEDQQGNIIGSIYYMAPEQFLRKPVDVRTDLYSLGCVFYQALSCRRPYSDDTVKGVMDAHLKHMVYPLKTVAPTVPQPICDWIMWLINTDPVHRPANADAALNSLREIVAAGWFNESTTEAVPVAIPVEEHGGWRTTDTIPRVPTGAQARPATGAISQRITSSVKRPTGTVPRRPSGAVPQRPAAQAASPVGPYAPVSHVHTPVARTQSAAAETSDSYKMPVWVWPAAAALVLTVGWLLWPRGSGSPTAQSKGAADASAKAEPPPAILAQRPADFMIKGAVIHYRAGEKMEGWNTAGKPVAPGGLVRRWHDLAGSGGDNWIGIMEEKQTACPKYVFEQPADFKIPIGLVRFDLGHGMKEHINPEDAAAKAFPFHADSPKKGVTLLMVMKPRIDQLAGVRLLRMHSQDGGSSLSLRAYPNNEWKFTVSAGGEVKDAIAKGRDTKKYALVSATWSGVTKKLVVNVRTSDGLRARTEAAAPAAIPDLLNDIRLGENAMGTAPSTTATVEDRFAGDVVELVVWPFAMEWEERSGLEWKIMQHYFKNPGSRY